MKQLPKNARFIEAREQTHEGVAFSFHLYTYNTRDGFAHISRMYKDGEHIQDAKAFYLNRTWERFEGQSVHLQAVEKAQKAQNIYKNTAHALRAGVLS